MNPRAGHQQDFVSGKQFFDVHPRRERWRIYATKKFGSNIATVGAMVVCKLNWCERGCVMGLAELAELACELSRIVHLETPATC